MIVIILYERCLRTRFTYLTLDDSERTWLDFQGRGYVVFIKIVCHLMTLIFRSL